MSNEELDELARLVKNTKEYHAGNLPMVKMSEEEADTYKWAGAPNAEAILGGKFYITVRRPELP